MNHRLLCSMSRSAPWTSSLLVSPLAYTLAHEAHCDAMHLSGRHSQSLAAFPMDSSYGSRGHFPVLFRAACKTHFLLVTRKDHTFALSSYYAAKRADCAPTAIERERADLPSRLRSMAYCSCNATILEARPNMGSIRNRILSKECGMIRTQS